MNDLEDVILVHEHEGTQGQQEITFHRYPYTDFPKIKSHIQPQFVLISLGRLLRKRSPAVLQAMEKEFSPESHQVPFLEIVQLYNHLISAPTDWMNDSTFCDAGHPFAEEKDDPKDKSYRPSGSVASSSRTQQKRDYTGLFKVPDVPEDAPPSPSRSSSLGGAEEDLGTLLERRSKRPRKAKTASDGGSQRGD